MKTFLYRAFAEVKTKLKRGQKKVRRILFESDGLLHLP